MKVRDPREGARRGLVWAAVLLAFIVSFAIGTSILNAAPATPALFATLGLYVLLAATAAGPIVVGMIRQASAHKLRRTEVHSWILVLVLLGFLGFFSWASRHDCGSV